MVKDSLRDSSSVFVQALNCIREPLLVIDPRGGFLFGNKSFYGFLNLKDEITSGSSVDSFWPSYSATQLDGDEHCTEFKTATQTLIVKLSLENLNDGCRLIRVVGSMPKGDASMQFHAQRLETLGMLASGIAHDFNNVLAGILGHISYLKTILPASGPHILSLHSIEEGGKKASGLTQQILNFSRIESSEKAANFDLGGLVERTCKLLRGAISREYDLNVFVPTGLIHVLGVEGRIAQVIVNLVVNARDAIPTNGSIEVRLDVVDDITKLKKVFAGGDIGSPTYARLSVIDNGQGISPDVMSRIFEPYFSTKKDKGTGLGLALVDQIVRECGGAITVASNVGRGTEISIYFPCQIVAGKSRNVSEVVAPLAGGRERILIIDDESPVRNVLSISLKHLGYEVETAASGIEALERLSQTGNSFDLVLLDMIMPHLAGEDVYLRLRSVDPNIRVLVISGFSAESSIKRILDNGGLGFLQKPFTIEELSKKVRFCLDV